VIEGLLREEAPAAKLNERADIPTDPQVVHNGSVFEMDHADLGRVRQPRHPARFSATPVAPPGRAPHLGEHTQQILQSLKDDPA
jgi:crotonobetainyl-CoA:carnitine CoA-transferase CaiB-like acyl-CoA transferase